MAARNFHWTRGRKLTADEKAAISRRCDDIIERVFRPRYLPEIRPTQFNYPIDLFGKWLGSKHRFITRYRSGFEDNAGWEFDKGYARLDHCEEAIDELRFNVMWHRHTGQWWPISRAVSLEEALHEIETNGILHPI